MTTRTERITAKITPRLANRGWAHADLDEFVAEILAIADDRQLLSLGDVSRLIGRAPTTIKSWLLDRQLTSRVAKRPAPPFPAPAYETGAGLLWDRDQVLAWMAEYPDQVRELA